MVKADEREFILDFIQLYKTLPTLWDTKCEEYTSRAKKDKCYQILVTKYREKYADATKQDVTKKLNSLRTNFRRELKRLKDIQERTGVWAESALWHFNAMSFLLDSIELKNREVISDPLLKFDAQIGGNDSQNCIPQKDYSSEADTDTDVHPYQLSDSTLEEEENSLLTLIKKRNQSSPNEFYENKTDILSSSTKVSKESPAMECDVKVKENLWCKERTDSEPEQKVEDILQPSTKQLRISKTVEFLTNKPQNTAKVRSTNMKKQRQRITLKRKRKKQQAQQEEAPQLLALLQKLMGRSHKENEMLISLYESLKKHKESECDKIAKTWALELNKLQPDQQIHAKKAINDILYEGQLGNLYRNCVQIETTQHTTVYYDNPAAESITDKDEDDQVYNI